jgi:hypothetical protein
VYSGVATEDVTTRTQLNHCSVALHNDGQAGMQQTALTESMALLTTTTKQDSQKFKDSSEVSVL